MIRILLRGYSNEVKVNTEVTNECDSYLPSLEGVL